MLTWVHDGLTGLMLPLENNCYELIFRNRVENIYFKFISGFCNYRLI